MNQQSSFIENEIVDEPTEIVTETKSKEIITIEERDRIVNRALDNFNSTVDKAKELVNKSKEYSLKLNGYEKILEAWRLIRAQRLDTEKTGKALREFSNYYNKIVKSREDELTKIFKPEEDRLYEMKKAHEDELERIKEEKRQEEMRKLHARVDALSQFGITLDLEYLKALDENSFQSIYNREKEIWDEKEQIRIQKEAEELAAQQQKEEEEEAARQALAIENNKLKAELEAANAEKKRLADEMLEAENKAKNIQAENDKLLATRDSGKSQTTFGTTPAPESNNPVVATNSSSFSAVIASKEWITKWAKKLDAVILDTAPIDLHPQYETAVEKVRAELVKYHNYLLKISKND